MEKFVNWILDTHSGRATTVLVASVIAFGTVYGLATMFLNAPWNR